jgi:hypothetical protein
MEMADRDTGLAPHEDTATLADRRRPGRVDFQNPNLIDLLRKPGDAPLPAEPEPAVPDAEFDEMDEGDVLAPSRGLFLGMMLGAGLWVAGGVTAWLLL